MSKAGFVLDASAVLALFQDEPGAEMVDAARVDAVVSAVNFCEVVGKLQELGFPDETVDEMLIDADLVVVDFDEASALLAGRLRCLTKGTGLSLGDRACLALGMRSRRTVLTADRAWRDVDLPVTVELIR